MPLPGPPSPGAPWPQIVLEEVAHVAALLGKYERAKATPSMSSEPGDLRALVQSQADAAGLSHALSSIDAVDTDRTEVVLNAVPFADWISWVAAMELHRIRTSSSRVEALPQPGMVHVTATFIRSMPE